MPDAALSTRAEQAALSAEDLPAFQGLKLLHVKNTIADALSMIGREKLFAEYTKHDLSHVDGMLELVDWLIPQDDELTATDWLLIVLTVYLHDLGMVVTQDEFSSRPVKLVDTFKEETLFQGSNADDYRARVHSLSPDEQNRFFYEEYVRATHGQRIRTWLSSEEEASLPAVAAEIRDVLKPLPDIFLKDLGKVCESHHLEDLGNTEKYSLDKPYGRTPEEAGNLQYAAVILRTADLFHITSDRTPPVLFRLINPTNPISQGEWTKQRAVRTVRPKVPTDDEGKRDHALQPSTIEVFADFKDPEGFFSLTSYLVYAKRQLRRSHEWVNNSARNVSRTYHFPWNDVDDSHVEAEGYLPKPFEFTIDQQRVLDLLTGHTLYNRTDVVIRELVQNSLDAVRLQQLMDNDSEDGRITISFDSADRILSVHDNGTGMTQRMVEDHLLKVGSSRYQDPEFQKEFPKFSAISRFGIGVLSAFMVADRVEVTTAHPEEEEARRLTLTDVHGRYLIKLLSKTDDVDELDGLLPHGTKFMLRLRPTARLEDIVQIVRNWIVVPRCAVTVSIDGGDALDVGFDSAGDALRDYLRAVGIANDDSSVEIRSAKRDGVELAWAVRWSKYFQNWALLSVGGRRDESLKEGLGMCVEGVRVEDGTPGYGEATFAAIANAVGPDAPKTNVARSGLEETGERKDAFQTIYSTLCGEVSNEIKAMVNERDVSLTWATEEARWLVRPLSSSRPRVRGLLDEALKTVPMLMVDRDGQRTAISPRELNQLDVFWTVESSTFRSAERMLRELAADVSLEALGKAFGGKDLVLPKGALVSGYDPDHIVTMLAFDQKEVARFLVRDELRRVDLEWQRISDSGPGWRTIGDLVDFRSREAFMRYGEPSTVSVAQRQIEVQGSNEETAVRAFNRLFLFADSPLGVFLNKLLDRAHQDGYSTDAEFALAFAENVVATGMKVLEDDADRTESMLERRLATLEERSDARGSLIDSVGEYLGLDEFGEALRTTRWKVFDPRLWLRPDFEA